MKVCPKCQQPVDDLRRHRRAGCLWTHKGYPNGSFELRHDRAGGVYYSAPNPFGGTWTWMYQTRVYGAHGSTADEGIRRRGKKWALRFEEGAGWTWAQVD